MSNQLIFKVAPELNRRLNYAQLLGAHAERRILKEDSTLIHFSLEGGVRYSYLWPARNFITLLDHALMQ
jgi:hypothetical protein